MRAVVCTEFGPPEVLRLTELAQPKPRKNQVCIRVVATAVTASDILVRSMKVPRRFRILFSLIQKVGLLPSPLVLGIVAAGVVDSVGRKVKSFRPGDNVFGLSQWRPGSYAEYVCWSAGGLLAMMPAGFTFEEAVALPYGGLLAMVLLRKVKIQAGQRVLVYGASGAIGTAMVQLAKHFGAKVTGVCSMRNLELVASLGADSVMDYAQTDFTTGSARYDVILDAVGRRKSAKAMLRASDVLAPGGTVISIDDVRPWLRKEDMLLIKRLAESGEFRPVIDRTYALQEIVEAHRYVDEGHKRGNVIVTVGRAEA